MQGSQKRNKCDVAKEYSEQFSLILVITLLLLGKLRNFKKHQAQQQ